MSGAVLIALFVTMAVVFMVGLFVMCLLKNNAPVQLSKSGAPSGKGKYYDVAAREIPKLMSALRAGEKMTATITVDSCPHCKVFKKEMKKMSGSLPCNMYFVNCTSNDQKKEAMGVPVMKECIDRSGGGVPATIVMDKSGIVSAFSGAMSFEQVQQKLMAY